MTSPVPAGLLALAAMLSCYAGNGPDATHRVRSATWLNSRPLSEDDLRGKVVLVDFWTFG